MLGRKVTIIRKKPSNRQSIARRGGSSIRRNNSSAAAAIAAFSTNGARHSQVTQSKAGSTQVTVFPPNIGSRYCHGRAVSVFAGPTTGSRRGRRGKPAVDIGRPSLYDALLQLKAQEDEKSLCHGEWSADQSMDQPSYGSIFLQIREANTEADSSFEFIKKSADIACNTIFVTVVLGMLVALPIGMISVGVKHLNDCPKEDKIPIYLMVGGCFGLLKLLSLLWKQMRSRRYERLDEVYEPDEDNGDVIMSKSSKFSEALLSLFLFIWFVCGNYWVFGIWKPNFKLILHEPSNWCDVTVYMFAFIQIMICYGLMALILLIITILAICHKYTMNKS